MKVVIINGLPGVGKTTIAKPLADELKIPLIQKDSIKEYLFDTLGVRDREWSRTLGMASNDFIFALCETLLSRGESVIIENSFEAAFAKPVLQKIIEKYQPEVYEIYCSVEASVRRQRFIDRNERGERHAGHSDKDNYPDPNDIEPLEKYAPLNLGTRIDVDTSNNTVDISSIVQRIG